MEKEKEKKEKEKEKEKERGEKEHYRLHLKPTSIANPKTLPSAAIFKILSSQ